MTAKYEQLVNDYADEIEKIKRYKAVADGILEEINAHDESAPTEGSDEVFADHYLTGAEIYRRWQGADDNYKIECERLSQDIEAEYNEVPFAKPRQQGIEKFWKLANI